MLEQLQRCTLCPRQCKVDRLNGEKGFCGASSQVKVAKASLHHWEEPCISGQRGSGTVFFSHCNLRCVFCQNHKISQEHFGKEISIEALAAVFLRQQEKGAHNINLVSPTQYIPQIAQALTIARQNGLKLPVVYNSNAYENSEALRMLEGLVDIYLPDLKYAADSSAVKYSAAPGYFTAATTAIKEMYRQVGMPVFDREGILTRGLLIRHLLLPGHLDEAKRILDWVKASLPLEIPLSLMSQYFPAYRAADHPEINKVVAQAEYDALLDYFLEIGLESGYLQETDSATSEYVPDFDLSGIENR